MLCPSEHCDLCPRLAAFRADNRLKFPDQFNAPVPSFGPQEAALLIVGLAPGLRGANFSGRPFTGDYAGDLLYATLLKFGFAEGTYGAHKDDGLKLTGCRITNAVRCVPPENKPTGPEIKTCQPFLASELKNLPNLRMILALGKIAHDAVIRTTGHKLSAFKFAHGALHDLGNGIKLANSYHCSRYNTNTGRLTEAMFEDVFAMIKGEMT
ncbi:MAG: uracil-DNA glycosylase [Rhodospirillales bacterium]|nr:uracil-DNA glycosylase [Rhodospirillales bacterium]MCB9997292.1 uracil-DNA glycosylase [Rhodospirillales bacterium]